MRYKKLIRVAVIGLLLVVVVVPVVDRFVIPEPDPPAWAYPAVDQVFRSDTEGFSQRIVKIDEDTVVLNSDPES